MNRLRLRDAGRPVWLPWLLMAAVVVAWLAPITVLGRMPIGGDVTSFFLPLMSYYQSALLAGRVPLWNELWGYGFPMLAESQAGVFYPPHVLLYWLFETETAYALNIVLHTVLSAAFAYVCGRQFGLKRWGASLTALTFAGNGFFIIHFPHQWSYTSGCWMPLAVALAWRVVTIEDRGSRVEDGALAAQTGVGRQRMLAAIGLAAVLAVQMLAGHFQIAFYTQVIVLLIGLLCTLWSAWVRVRSPAGRSASPLIDRARPLEYRFLGSGGAVLWVTAPVVAAFVLAAVQVLPTYELIRIALPEGRDFEYLSGFANTPFHLVSYLLPTLFHVSPLWRTIAWDPFHTSPEECFSYVGLLPICLAIGAAWRWRREPRVRLWVLLTVITLLLSLGPYQPFFRALIHVPGFAGFRSSARWSIATALFLALLAGRAVDGTRSIDRLWLWLRRLLMVFASVVLIYVAVVLVFVQAGSKPLSATWSRKVVEWSAYGWRAVSPWEDHDDLTSVAIRANEPQRSRPGMPAAILAREIRTVLLQETVPPFMGIAGILICLFCFSKSKSMPRWALLTLVAVDLGAAGWLRPTDFAPRGRIVEQSAVLRYLRQHAQGERVSDFQQNLAMLAGAAPVNSYRTVDIPFATLAPRPESFTQWTWHQHAQDRSGVAWEIWQAKFGRPPLPAGSEDTVINDPILARIIEGRAAVQGAPPAATSFVIRRRNELNLARAWFWDARLEPERFERLLDRQTRNRKPSDTTHLWLYSAPVKPVPASRLEPGRMEFDLESTGRGMLVINELAYPGWQASITIADGKPVHSEAIVSGAGCLLVPISEPGTVHVQLRFQSPMFRRGLAISLVMLAVGVLIGVFAWRMRGRTSTSSA